MKKAWMIKLKMGKQPSASAVVCSKHFKKEDFVYPVYKTQGYKYRKLVPEAIPSVNLPVRPSDARRSHLGLTRQRQDDWEPPLVDEPQSPAAAVGKSGATPEAIEQESNLFFPAVQPADASSTAAAGCTSATVASGAAASPTTAEAVATGDASRAPRGRMALLERSLADENDYRAALLREEHGLRLQLMREDHNSILQERQEKKLLDIQKKKLEILEIEKQIKLEQLRRLREAPE
ncbi:hypothetical protein V5799_022808 [Amblyomma americanum]|uniref:THAP-type domain-containing protein n=1 Tax=Amblyomma americanum TaxID=6943 RepID=A0AAQ4FK13_AMBAM